MNRRAFIRSFAGGVAAACGVGTVVKAVDSVFVQKVTAKDYGIDYWLDPKPCKIDYSKEYLRDWKPRYCTEIEQKITFKLTPRPHGIIVMEPDITRRIQ